MKNYPKGAEGVLSLNYDPKYEGEHVIAIFCGSNLTTPFDSNQSRPVVGLWCLWLWQRNNPIRSLAQHNTQIP